MLKRIHRSKRALLRAGLFGCAATCAVPAAMAIAVDTGNPDLTVRWDNSIRFNAGVRTQAQDQRILNNQNYDESDGKFAKGDFVTKRLDLLTELDLNYKNSFGARVSGAAWYDAAYSNTSVHTSAPGGYQTSYFNDEYNATVKRYTRGPSGEILDAFAWVNFRIADKPANLKVGRLTNYWGESYVLGAHAISYSQSPVDGVKAVTSPGIELKEVFLPLGQIYLKFQPTPNLSLAAQYFVEWKPSRLPHGGTYLAPADIFFEGPDRLPVQGGALSHAASIKPKNAGNFGLSAKFNAEAIESTIGLYYRQFDDYMPWFAPNLTNFMSIPGVGVVPTAYQLVYPKKVKMLAASFARVIGPVSVGADLSYRMNGALAAGQMLNPANSEGARGDTWHAVVNGVYLLPKTPLFDTGSVLAEFAYNRLQKVTSNESSFAREGTVACVNGVTGAVGDKSDGCATKDYLGMALIFTPQYLQVRPSWDLETPLSVTYGIRGNAPSSGGGNEGSLSWSLAAKATYAQKHEFQVMYSAQHAQSKYDPTGTTLKGGNGSTGTTDRGWLAFTYKTSF